ncbi:SRPBCC family protein [Streptomyces fructofermentans]|uniref:SRPBCC family protein n=1 Tax=Streptomyces fructofermentans TaxID=152141 RepID=UPI00340722D6
MDFTNEFRVNLPADRAWALLTDVERIAPCMPGAQLTGVDGEAYNGIVKVRVGPMTVQYKGVVSFEEKDDEGRTAVLHARGRDTRGQGNADARVTAVLVPDGDGTRVTVDTRLTITGRIAQFGRGVIQEVSGKLLAQFVDNLEEQLADERRRDRADEQAPTQPEAQPEPVRVREPEAEPEAEPAAAEEPAEEPAAAPAPEAGTESPLGPGTAGPGPGQERAPAAPAPAAPETGPVGGVPATGADGEGGPAPSSGGARPGRAPLAPHAPGAAEPEPLDLMSVARGAVLKRALPVAAALVVLVVVLVVWLA